jgi:hypothetical protein
MIKNYLNTIFPFKEQTSKKEREVLIIISVSIISFVACFVFAILVLPKNCSLFFSNVPGPQMCHTIPLPEGCYDSFCKDAKTEYAASIIAGLGICLLFLPLIVYAIQNLRKRQNEQTKLFD